MDHFNHTVPIFNRGNILALVLVVTAILAISMFSTHSFISNRTLQVRKTTVGIKQAEIALRALLDIHQECFENRPSSQSFRFTRNMEGFEAEIFVEERIANDSRWIAGKTSGKYKMLDSMHYLAQVCKDKKCWVAAAEEVFSPEPLAAHTSYAAYDSGFTNETIQPIRMFSYLNNLGPGEWQSMLNQDCSDLKVRGCRIQLLEKLRSRNWLARKRSYLDRELIANVKSKAILWPVVMEERFLFDWFKNLETESSVDSSELDWMTASMDILLNFQAPANTSAQDISIRKPREIEPLNEAQKRALKNWFNLEKFNKPSHNFQDIYYHKNMHALRHLSIEAKWKAALYSDPKSLPLKMSQYLGLSINVIKYSVTCAKIPVNDSNDLLRLQTSFNSDRSLFRQDDCSQTADLSIEPIVTREKLRESPRLFVGPKPWLSLESLWLLYAKLGGVASGLFPKIPIQSFEKNQEISSDIDQGYLVFPYYDPTLN